MAPSRDPITPTERALHSAIGAARRWSRTPDRTAATAAPRAAFISKFADDARAEFPAATDEQVHAMAEQRRREFYLRLAAKSVASRRRRAGNNTKKVASPAKLTTPEVERDTARTTP